MNTDVISLLIQAKHALNIAVIEPKSCKDKIEELFSVVHDLIYENKKLQVENARLRLFCKEVAECIAKQPPDVLKDTIWFDEIGTLYDVLMLNAEDKMVK